MLSDEFVAFSGKRVFVTRQHLTFLFIISAVFFLYGISLVKVRYCRLRAYKVQTDRKIIQLISLGVIELVK